MAAVTLEQIKKLRELTGAGMTDCKKALEATNGDMEAAVEYLRKKGAAAAAKRVDRSADEGLIWIAENPDHTAAALVEVNCETDFVARNEQFADFARAIAEAALRQKPQTLQELLQASINGKTVEDALNETLAKFGEKIVIKRFSVIETDGYLTSYIHPGNRLGVVVEFNQAPASDEVAQGYRDIAMQIAAMSPLAVGREDLDPAVVEKEKAVYREQVQQQGKPEHIAERIVEGKMNKFYQEVALIEQSFVKNPDITVQKYLEELSEKQGSPVTIRRFWRYQLGEQVEQPVEQ